MRGINKKGFTLIEILIAAFLFLLVSGIVLGVAVIAKRYWQAAEGSIEVKQNTYIATEKVMKDVSDSSIDTFTDNTSETDRAIGFLSAYNTNGIFVTNNNGEIVWQKYIIYYIKSGDNRLLRKEVYGSFTDALTTAELRAQCDGKGRVAAFNIKSFSADVDKDKNNVAIIVGAETTDKNGKKNSFSMDENFYFNN